MGMISKHSKVNGCGTTDGPASVDSPFSIEIAVDQPEQVAESLFSSYWRDPEAFEGMSLKGERHHDRPLGGRVNPLSPGNVDFAVEASAVTEPRGLPYRFIRDDPVLRRMEASSKAR